MMVHKGKSRSKSRVMRLLTFVCFFNFSGLNNGYTYLASMSPVNPVSSISFAGSLYQNFSSFVSPQDIAGAIKEGHRAIVSWTMRTERLFKGLVKNDRARSLRERTHSVRRAGTVIQKGSQIEARQESYLKRKQENWIKKEDYEKISRSTILSLTGKAPWVLEGSNGLTDRRYERDPRVLRRILTPMVLRHAMDDPSMSMIFGAYRL